MDFKGGLLCFALGFAGQDERGSIRVRIRFRVTIRVTCDITVETRAGIKQNKGWAAKREREKKREQDGLKRH